MRHRARAAAACMATLAACAHVAEQARPTAAEVPDAVVQYALTTMPSGDLVRWHEEVGGAAGTITPIRTFKAAVGFCRDYAVTMQLPDGRGWVTQATACRNAQGQWRPPVAAS